MFKFIKDWFLLIVVISSALLHPWVSSIAFISPYLISIVLIFAFSNMSIKELKIERSHIICLTLQIILGSSLYFLLTPYNKILAMGVMICALCPTAGAAPATVKLLGGNVAYTASYLLLCNVVMAVVIPLLISIAINNQDVAFINIFMGIVQRVVILLILPMLTARLIKRLLPKLNQFLTTRNDISFYIWTSAIIIAIANTIRFIIDKQDSAGDIIATLIIASFIMCTMQFSIGYLIGRYYKENVTIKQVFGQRNSILAIWMSQTFMEPLSSIVPAGYVMWQNLINSYQIYKTREKSS